MTSPLKLIVEHTDFNQIEIISEQANVNSPKTFFIYGPYIQCNCKNANGREYTTENMDKTVEDFRREKISTGRSVGELNHPPTTEIDFDRCCHLILDLERNGSTYFGKSKSLIGTPKGDLLNGLLANGVKVGISTRGVGNISQKQQNVKLVENYKLITADIVYNPSGPDCYLNGIFESKNYMIDQYGEIMEMTYNSLNENLKILPLKNAMREAAFMNAIQEFIRAV